MGETQLYRLFSSLTTKKREWSSCRRHTCTDGGSKDVDLVGDGLSTRLLSTIPGAKGEVLVGAETSERTGFTAKLSGPTS